VEENLDLGALFRRNPTEAKTSKAEVFELFPRLEERRGQQADTLSGGERQMLAISRAYMARPQLLLLDEPSLGLAPLVIEQIFQSIRHIVDSMGVTVVLVEQNAMGALKIADYGVVLNLGTIAASGKASDLIADPAVRAAYLGF
jgi:branched-chain amino acid transport system ATP-binding protein